MMALYIYSKNYGFDIMVIINNYELMKYPNSYPSNIINFKVVNKTAYNSLWESKKGISCLIDDFGKLQLAISPIIQEANVHELNNNLIIDGVISCLGLRTIEIRG